MYILKIAGAVDDMIARQRAGDLDVQVVSNSYGLSNDYDFNPVSASNVAMWYAFKEGILPVFSAGNSGTPHGTLNYAVKAPYILGVAATHDGDLGYPKKPVYFSSRGRPPKDEFDAPYVKDDPPLDSLAENYQEVATGEDEKSGYAPRADYENTEGAHYDRKTALENVRAFHESNQDGPNKPDNDDAPGPEKIDESRYRTPIDMTVQYGVHPAYFSQYGPSSYDVWEPTDDAGYLKATVTWQPQGQSISLKIHESPKPKSEYGEDSISNEDVEEWPVIASGGELINDGEFVLEAAIDGDRLYGFELEGEYNALSRASIAIDLWKDNDSTDGPFGIYRIGVGAPGSAVISTMSPNDPLHQLGPAYAIDYDRPAGSAEEYGETSAENAGVYAALSGTSMSCPVTSGICALAAAAYRREAGHHPKPVDLLNIMEVTAEGGTERELFSHTEANMGAGFVNAVAAVELAAELGSRAPEWPAPAERGEYFYTEPDHPELFEQVDLCDYGTGTRALNPEGTREDDGSVFTPGQVNQVEVRVTNYDPTGESKEARVDTVRDTIPASWTVVEGNHDRVVREGDRKHVVREFDSSVAEADLTYFAEAPDAQGEYDFGPAAVASDDQPDVFAPAETTRSEERVLGVDQNSL